MATEEDKTNTGALLTLVAVSTFAMIAVTLAVTAIARDEVHQAFEDKEGPGGDQYQELRRTQLGSLGTGVSIEQTMQKVVEGLARDPSSATPPPPAPTVAAAPAPAAGAIAAGGAPAATPAAVGGAPAAPTQAPAEKPGAAGQKPKPAVPPAKPLAPKPVPVQPSPAAPPTPPHG